MTVLSQTPEASEMIERRARVDRSRTPQEAIAATGRRQYVERAVVAGIPRGEGDEVTIFFFKVCHHISDDDLETEYASRGLIPADPYSLLAVNEADPAFADDHPNGTHWKDESGRWCYVSFNRWRGDRPVRTVRVGHNDYGWGGRCWFAGCRT